MDREMTDREVYPAVCCTLLLLTAGFLIWRYLLHSPTLSGCWIYQNWHIYCPGCGGTRALQALAKGQILHALWYHPLVPIAAFWGCSYWISQTIWRIRRGRGRVLRYDRRWPYWLLGLLLINWIAKNILLLCGIGL